MGGRVAWWHARPRSTTSPTRLFPLYGDEVQRGVQVECRRRGYALMIGGTRTAPHLSQVIDVAGRVDGLIAFAGAVSETALRQVSGRIPVVELGGEVRADGVRTIYVDNRQGMADLTSHLLAVHGHRRFGYHGELGTPEFRQRFNGFTATLRAAGLPVPPVTRSHPGDDDTAAVAVRGFLDPQNDAARATSHLWDLWNEKDYPHYRDHRPRFVAEFGWQGPPTWSTLTGSISDDPLTPGSPGMIVHQKAAKGNDKLTDGLVAHFPLPDDMAD